MQYDYRKNEMLDYLKVLEWKLIHMFPTLFVVRKINNANYQDYVNKKLNNEINIGNTRLTKAFLDSFKLKRLEQITTEEPLKGNEVKL